MDIGVKVGAAGVAAGVMIGGVTAEDGNLIAGNNGPGIEQTGGTGALNVLRNVFGESPDSVSAGFIKKTVQRYAPSAVCKHWDYCRKQAGR